MKLVNANNNNFLWLRDEVVGTIIQSDDTWATSRNIYLSGYDRPNIGSPYNNNYLNRDRIFRLGERLVYSGIFKFFRGANYCGSNLWLTTFYNKLYTGVIAASAENVTYGGFMIDTSIVKDFRLQVDKPGRYLVRMYDANGDLLESNSPNEYVNAEFTPKIAGSGYKHQFSVDSDKLSACFGFKDAVKKVFIGGRLDTMRKIEIFTKSTFAIQASEQNHIYCQDLPVSVNDMVSVGDCVFVGGRPLWVSAIAADYSVTMVDATGAVVSQ